MQWIGSGGETQLINKELGWSVYINPTDDGRFMIEIYVHTTHSSIVDTYKETRDNIEECSLWIAGCLKGIYEKMLNRIEKSYKEMLQVVPECVGVEF